MKTRSRSFRSRPIVSGMLLAVAEAIEARKQAAKSRKNAVRLLRGLNEDGSRFVAVETS